MLFDELPESTLEILKHEFSLAQPVPRTLRFLSQQDDEKWRRVKNRLIELTAMTPLARATANGEIQARIKQREADLAAIAESQRPFNLVSAKADIGHWSRAALWSLEEAVALSFGKSPEIVHSVSVAPFSNISPFAREYLARRDLVWRALQSGDLKNPTSPLQFIGWAQQLELQISPELISVVSKYALPIEEQPVGPTAQAVPTAVDPLAVFSSQPLTPPSAEVPEQVRMASEWRSRVWAEHLRRAKELKYKKMATADKVRAMEKFCLDADVRNARGAPVSFDSILHFFKSKKPGKIA